MAQNNIITWDVNSIRITVFSENTFSDTPKTYWPNSADFEISSLTEQPKTLETIIQGTYKDKQLALTHTPIKLDLYLTAPIEDVVKTKSFPVIGGLKDTLKEFNDIVDIWLNQSQLYPFRRIALGVDLVKNVATLEEGYKQISKYLPIEVKFGESTDFRLQINKPIKSKAEADLEINRLSVWNVLTANLTLSNSAEPSSARSIGEKHYCHLSLDINTSQKYDKLFDQEKSKKIFKELNDLAIEVSVKGVK